MAKDFTLVFVMFAVVLLSGIILGIATYYGTEDWNWIAEQNASLVLVIIVLALAAFTLVGWLKKR